MGCSLAGQRLQGLHHLQLLLVEALHFLLLEEFFNFLTQQRREASEIQSVFIAARSKVLKRPAERNHHFAPFGVHGNQKLSRRAILHRACLDLMVLLRVLCFYKKGNSYGAHCVALVELCHLMDTHDGL